MICCNKMTAYAHRELFQVLAAVNTGFTARFQHVKKRKISSTEFFKVGILLIGCTDAPNLLHTLGKITHSPLK